MIQSYLRRVKGFMRILLFLLFPAGLLAQVGDTKILLDKLKSYQANNEEPQIASCYFQLGNKYWQNDSIKQAIDYFEKSLAMYQKLGGDNGIKLVSESLGILSLEQGNPERSVHFFQTCLSVNRKKGDKGGLTLALLNLSKAQVEFGQGAQAAKNLKEAISLSKELNDMSLLADAYQLNAKAQQLLGNMAESTSSYDSYMFYKSKVDEKEIKSMKQSADQALTKVNVVTNEKNRLEQEKQGISIQLDSVSNQLLTAEKELLQKKVEELQAEQKKIKEQAEYDRLYKSYYLWIAAFFIFTFIIFLTVTKVKINPLIAKGVILFCMLLSFEFILVAIDRFTDLLVKNNPFYKLCVNIVLALVMLPISELVNNVVKNRLNNNKLPKN
jgi:tetratricopeptide (TPR) repeat protein